MYNYHYQKKINFTEEMLSKENITVTLRLIHCMLEITLGVKTCMRQKFLTLIRIDVKSNVHTKKGLNT